MILRREVPAQQSHGGEGHLSRGEEVEDQREAAAGPGGLDSVAGRVFRQPKSLGTVTEQGPVALGGIERGAGVARGQMGHQLDRHLAFSAREHREACEEIPIR